MDTFLPTGMIIGAEGETTKKELKGSLIFFLSVSSSSKKQLRKNWKDHFPQPWIQSFSSYETTKKELKVVTPSPITSDPTLRNN